jgi:hypothetical protein
MTKDTDDEKDDKDGKEESDGEADGVLGLASQLSQQSIRHGDTVEPEEEDISMESLDPMAMMMETTRKRSWERNW